VCRREAIVDLEGELCIGVRVDADRVDGIRIASTRPDAARSLLQGRTRAEIAAALPLLFSICGRSQAAAGELACAVAAGEATTADALARCSAEVSAEVVREHAWRTLLDWPRWIGEAPAAAAVAAARASAPSRDRAVPSQADASAIATAAFGSGAAEWLATRSVAELDRWVDAGATAAARFIRRVRDEERAIDGGPAPAAALLDARDRAADMSELWAACEADPGFVRRPTRGGAPAETGALARLRADPLIAALLAGPASRVFARFVARLRELALLLAGGVSAAAGAQAAPSGGGIAWVENARGLLIHHVQLDGDRAVAYRIVAPTEWNFHPEGALASSLMRAPAADREALTQRVVRTARSLDPCVSCRVEFDHA
jgi:hypothetical protein